jgi:AraC-like DNA-binding protein
MSLRSTSVLNDRAASGGPPDPGSGAADWIASGFPVPGWERIEARFTGHAYDPHRHDRYAIGLTLEGVQSFDYRGERVDSLAGQALVLHPDEVHDGRAGVAGGFRYRMLYLDPRSIADALGDQATALPFLAGGRSSDPRLVQAAAAALTDLDRVPEPLDLQARQLAVAEALLALDPSARRRRPADPACVRAVDRARELLDATPDAPVTAEALEAACGVDRWTLARAFRRRLGTSPHRYAVLRRLDRVRDRLLAGDSLAVAAAEAGFADQAHMTRQFRRAHGLPPGRWRRLVQGHPGTAEGAEPPPAPVAPGAGLG